MAEISSSSWSETDASNNSPAPNGWPEGQSMSSLNDCGRAVMGAVKRAWNRLNGKYVTTGSSNAYVLTPDVALPAYATGERYSFRANFANTGSCSLNISGLGARTIKKYTGSGTATLASGDIQSGQPVTVEYDGTDMILVTPHANLPTSADVQAATAPTGSVIPFAGTAQPAGWLLCFGQAVLRTEYAALFTAIGTTYGTGDGSTTFNVPDLRGRVVAGQDDMGGTSANRLTNQTGGVDGDTLGATGGAETHTLTTAQMPAHTHTYVSSAAAGSATVGAGGNFGSANTGSTGGDGAHNNVQPTIILNYIIKT
jgi:microcystin-dependent protein